MTYELAIGDRTYSSWSLRGWLLFSKFDIPVSVRTARMYSQGFKDLLSEFAPARLVPAAKIDGYVVYDTLAMAETLADNHVNMWPSDPAARAMARSISAEMHSGFSHLRTDCTMNLRHCYPDFQASDAVLADCARIEQLWNLARSEFGADGPWLFGEYSIADVMYAPVATRFATYNLPRNAVSDAYIAAHLADQNFRQWRACGLAENYVQPGYDLELTPAAWPGPAPLATGPADGSALNETCPFSGNPVSHFLSVEGKTYGTCNSFCRDKAMVDPEAWPQFMDMMARVEA